MQLQGRTFSSADYRYGFNGKEKDGDINSLTAYDYGFRIYNSAVGKFLSVDPLTNSYPWYTPYQFAGNKPIICIDLDGLEDWMTTQAIKLKQRTAILNNKFQLPNTSGKQDPVTGTVDGIGQGAKNLAVGFWNLVTHPIESIKSAEEFLFQGGLSMSTVKVYETPVIDRKTDEFIEMVIKGDAKSRSTYATEFIGGLLLAKGLGKTFTVLKNMTLAQKIIVRTNFATAFYEGVGGNVRDIIGINLKNFVSRIGLTNKISLYQWTIEGKLGDYFCLSKDAKNLGLPQMPDGTPAYFDRVTNSLKPRTLVEIKLNEGVKVDGLKSVAADAKPWDGAPGINKGGDIQVYAPEVKTTNPQVNPIK